jgi:chaperonin cofactor prefoldin
MTPPIKQDLESIYKKLLNLAKIDKDAFEKEAGKLKEEFIKQAPDEHKQDLQSMQDDIDKELSSCKTSEERFAVIFKRARALRVYIQDMRNGTAPICAKAPNLF